MVLPVSSWLSQRFHVDRMKTLLLLFCSALSLSAQNFGVTFYATNSVEVLAGMPKFYPKSIDVLGTNTFVTPPAVLMTGPQLQDCFRTNQSAYDSYSDSVAKVRTNANLARLIFIYSLIPTGRTICSNDLASSATIEASLASGTNSQSQVVTRMRQLNNTVNDALVIENQILELLQRLGPVLKSMYRPEEDTTP